ncbi:MAG: type II toxin-antitoxin system PemK/MazF family toxin [Acidipropionibacterium sp.]|jgi:mRNA interferase MazF|nr:type II toxin-antitoxin system PemK/MazF family toxin [Acidipropionibacterium sp.]
MQRGEIWTLRDDRYASKARPVVVVQGDLEQFDSVVLCLLTVEQMHAVSRQLVRVLALTKDDLL